MHIREYDVVVVGSGAGGLVAAITVAYHGLNTVIVEKGDEWGESSALSGGVLWIPNNHVSKKAGLQDSEEEAHTYMQEVIEDTGPASTYKRKVAFGLYATGNCSASGMGSVYPGPGSTLGPTTVFGYISANHKKENMFRLVDPSVKIV